MRKIARSRTFRSALNPLSAAMPWCGLLALATLLFPVMNITATPARVESAWRNAQVLRGFVLTDAKGRVLNGVSTLSDGAVLDLANVPTKRLNIRLRSYRNRRLKVERVRFELNGNRRFRIAREAPFTLFSSRQVRKRSWTLPTGSYQILAAPYRSRRSKSPGVTSSISFTVVNSNPTPQVTPSPSVTPNPPTPPAPPIPEFAKWRSQMLTYGDTHCDPVTLQSLSTWEGSVWYYDGIRVYQQIADYTGNNAWLDCARYVRDIYRPYVLQNNGRVGGWRVFPHGLAQDYLRFGDQASFEATLDLATNSPFAYVGGGPGFELSRETAYLLNAHLMQRQLGAGDNPLLQLTLENAIGHMNQWFVSQSATYVKPFMVGLTMEALINAYEELGDPRIPPLIATAVDWLWNHAWDASTQSFRYIVCRAGSSAVSECSTSQTPAPDLNHLIAPAFAWMYHRTGEAKYQIRGDVAFVGGVNGAWLANGKQFSQSYRWSFDYIRWRS